MDFPKEWKAKGALRHAALRDVARKLSMIVTVTCQSDMQHFQLNLRPQSLLFDLIHHALDLTMRS